VSRGFKIAELAKRSGTPKETIHYYLRIGLLRKPKKTSRNMAYYDDAHVEQLQLIKRLRTESYLPLSVIKKVLKEGKLAESTRKIDLAGDLFGQGAKAELEPLTKEQLAERVGVEPARVDAWEQAGLLFSRETEERKYGWEDLRVAEILAHAEDEAGSGSSDFLLERFSLLEEHTTDLVRAEAAQFFSSIIATSDPKRAWQLLTGGKDTVGRYLAVARVRRLRFEIEALLVEVQGALQSEATENAIVLSSHRRHQDEPTTRDNLEQKRKLNPHEVEPAHELLEHLIRQGDYEDAIEAAQALPEGIRDHERIRCRTAEAYIEVAKWEEAFTTLAPFNVDDRPPNLTLDVLLAIAILARLRDRLIAAEANSVQVIGELVDGMSRLYAARAAPPVESAVESLRIRFLLGRLESGMPQFLGRGKPGRHELRALLEEMVALSGTDDDPGLGTLERLELQATEILAHRTRNPKERAELEARAAAIIARTEPSPA